jgi:hypothetical protein
VLAAVLSTLTFPVLLITILPLRKPISDWLFTHGWQKLAIQYAFVHYRILYFLLSFASLAVLGYLARDRWLRVAIVFSLSFVLACDVLDVGTGSAAPLDARRVRSMAIQFPWDILAAAPFSIVGGWLAAKLAKRRYARLHAHELCASCGYSLFGNVSGRCPECGTNIPLGGVRPSNEGPTGAIPG